MQYRRSILALVLAVAAAPAVNPPVHAQSPPDGQTPQYVARLQNFGTMVSFLNLASGTVRLVAILEPSSPDCGAALDAVRSILDANQSKRLRAYIVWTRLSAEDTETRALSMANQIRDRRLVHFWDAEAFVAGSFRGVIGSGADPVTGVVLLYDTDARLAMEPPGPSMWMSTDPGLQGHALDAGQLGASVNTMVRRVEAKVTDVTTPKP